MLETRKTVCNRDCPDACESSRLSMREITKIRGTRSIPSRVDFFAIEQSFLSTQYSPDRIKSPLLRHNGKFHPISWDEALDIAATTLCGFGMSPARQQFSLPKRRFLGLLKHLCDYFFEQFGQFRSTRDICSGAGDTAQELDSEEDSHDLFDLLNSRNIVLWGKNVFTSSPHSVPVLMEAELKAPTVLIDPSS